MVVAVLGVTALLLSSALLTFTFPVLWSLSFGGYPNGVLLLLPWILGLCGTLGLANSLRRIEHKSSLQLRIEAALLGLGGIGALAFVVIAALLLASGLQGGLSNLMFALPLLLVLLPSLTGILAILRARQRWRGMEERERLWPALVLVGLTPLLLCGVRVLGQEAVMAWYGRDLPARADAAAQNLAGSAGYCILRPYGASSFAQLDTRALLLKALEQRYGFRQYVKDPHFGILVNGREYWWSFGANNFVTLPGDHAGATCSTPAP